MTLLVLVPRADTRAALTIRKGSAVVALDDGGAQLSVYFEGNLYNAVNLRKFDQRLLHASGRLMLKYPTTARGFFPRDQFDVVGLYHAVSKVFMVDVDSAPVLNTWLDGDDDALAVRA